MQKKNPKNIIVRMPNWIGDLVMATPVLAALRKGYPDAEITAMCRKPMGTLLEKDPNIDQIFSFDKADTFWRRLRDRDVVAKLKTGKFDLGVLLTNSFSTAWLFWQGNVKRRLGFRGNGRNWLLTDAIPFPEKRASQHLVKTYRQLLESLNLPQEPLAPKLYISADEQQQAWELLQRFGVDPSMRLAGINPGAAYGEAKCWLPERFAEVARRLLEDERCCVLFFGDAGSKELVNGICKDLPKRAVNLAGFTSLRQLMALTSLVKVVVTNDSGPMHIAAALNRPVIALFGSTDHTVSGPFETGHVIYKNANCSPCFKRTCPIDFRCMKQIGVAEVLQLTKEYLWD